MPPQSDILPLLQDLKTGLQTLYQAQIEAAILYGSYARGEQTPDSDVDILILLNTTLVSSFSEIDRMGDLIIQLQTQYNQLLIIMPVSRIQFEAYNFPIFKSIKKEGIWL